MEHVRREHVDQERELHEVNGCLELLRAMARRGAATSRAGRPPEGGRDISFKAFRHVLRVLTSVGSNDRGATSGGKSVGATPAQKRATLLQPAGRLLRPQSKMTT